MRRLDQYGRFRQRATEMLRGGGHHLLEDAVPAIPSVPTVPTGVYGWADKGLPIPATGGFYVGEFVEQDRFNVLAYVDPFGRAFTEDESTTVPPARVPDLIFAKVEGQSAEGEELGSVHVYQKDGSRREVARYRCAHKRYTLFDSWYDFGSHGANLTYAQAMARAYLALVHRPFLGAPAVPERGLAGVHERLRNGKPLTAMRSIVLDARCADDDPACRPPSLVSCLAHWLDEAGLGDLDDIRDEAFRLVRTLRYANTYYLGVEDESASISTETVWALEAALNRFLLVGEALEEHATLATEAECARWDSYLMESVGMQHAGIDNLAPAEGAEIGGEWSVRRALGVALERLRLPVRVEVVMRCDVAAGVVAFDMTVPGAALMPRWAWQEEGGWAEASSDARREQAQRYALRIGLVLASAAFDVSSKIQRIDIAARPCGEAQARLHEREFPQESRHRAFVCVSLGRDTYEALEHFAQARTGDPMEPYVVSGAHFDTEEAEAFAYVNALPSSDTRQRMPEVADGELSGCARTALGAECYKEVRISFDAALRHRAEALADKIVRASSATDAIRWVRTAQDEAAGEDDDRTVVACTRLMAALAEGEIDMGDQNAVVSCFLGDDRCFAALGRARAVSSSDPKEAVRILVDAVEEASALDGFVDGATTVHRAFDSYASRVLYNRARRGAGAPARARADSNKRVELVPDSYLFCHLEIAQLLERSFDRTEEALRFGGRAIELSPATAAGYRQLGRAYMLVGDMENAATVLQEGLFIAVQPSEIAMAYYQLAYVLWKVGRTKAGAACYVKSLVTSSTMALQATAELQELVDETGLELPDKETVDEELKEYAVPVAPTDEVLEALGTGAAAATDAGLFPVARNLLALSLRYRPDDALVNVLRSLDE